MAYKVDHPTDEYPDIQPVTSPSFAENYDPKGTVLVCEKDHSIRNVLQKFLKKTGLIDITYCSSVEELETLCSDVNLKISLIITQSEFNACDFDKDAVPPGLTFVREHNAPNKQYPVIFASSPCFNGYDGIEEEFAKMPHASYLENPIRTTSGLIRTILSVLRGTKTAVNEACLG